MNCPLQEHAVRERRRALLIWRHESFKAPTHILPACFDGIFAQRVSAAVAATAQRGCEHGFTLTTGWGEIVVGGAQEISTSDDPSADYYAHLRRLIPRVMIHTHPTKRLGFSRSDCLTADTVTREAGVLTHAQQSYRPIFGVAVDNGDEHRVLLVQRKAPGVFMNFSEIGQAYDADAWLACPAFNVAVLSVQPQSGVITVVHNTGLVAALT